MVNVEYTDKNVKDMEYLIYTIFMGKEFSDNKFKLSYTNDVNNKYFIVKDISKYDSLKCLFKNKISYLNDIIKQGDVENFLTEVTNNVNVMMKKRAKLLTEQLNNFRIGNNVGYMYLHLICGYTLCYLLTDKIELLKLNNKYDFNDFDDDYLFINKYKEVFNKKLQREFKVKMVGGDDKKDDNNKFSFYKNNTDEKYIDFINDFFDVVKKNKRIIKSILNKNIK